MLSSTPVQFVTVTFHGVRGSTPVPGPHTQRYGGNTSCVSVRIDGRVLVIDGGTGIRSLGHQLAGGDDEIYVLFTHLHDDHIQGFPFFAPLYEPGREVHLMHYRPPGGSASWSPMALFDGKRFPLTPGDVPAVCHHVKEGGRSFLKARGFDVDRLAVNHPGGAYGYRLSHAGRTFVHVPDNELRPPDGGGACSVEEMSSFCRGADLLCHDAQYRQEDLPAKWGWGHSLVSQACELAASAQAEQLVLFHHDPERTDAEVDTLEVQARTQLEGAGIACAAAQEGMQFDGRKGAEARAAPDEAAPDDVAPC